MANFVFAFMDCEMGGLDPELHDITEIGLILTDDRLAESSQREWKVKARAERITPASIEISGYDAAVWEKEALPIRQVLTELADALPKDCKVVPAGQNVRMDVMFLERAYKNCGIAWPFDYHVIDLATLFYAWSLVAGEKIEALSLRQAATRAGLAQNKVAHRALADARLTLETFRHYVARLSPRELPEDAAAPIPIAVPPAPAAAPE
jgi:DNA polymerase III epsilon subunit-like protein